MLRLFARLFISYNRKESPYAWAIRQWLMKEQGWSSEEIFFDASHLHAGVDWEKKLLAQAEAAEVMLFLASENSLNINSFCYRELKHAKGTVLAVTLGGVRFDDERLDRALSHSAKTRQVTQLDKSPGAPYPYLSPVDGVTTGTVHLHPDCLAGIGAALRELGVAPNSYSWKPKSPEDVPYPGLRPLAEGDEALFCGRDLEIRDGIKALEDLLPSVLNRALVIQAPSGAGKSSFLRAGLWQRLRRNPGFTPLAIIRTPNNPLRNPDWGLVRGLFHTTEQSRQKNLALDYDEIARRAADDLPGLIALFADADAGPAGRRTLLVGIDQAEEMTALSPEDDAGLDHLLGTLLHLPHGFDLGLVSVASPDQLPVEGRSLVLVALVGGSLHIRIFDTLGQIAADKALEELKTGAELDALAEVFNVTPFPAATAFTPERKSEIIALAASVAGHHLSLDLRLVLTARDDSVDATLARLARAGLRPEQIETWRLHRIPPSRLDDIVNGPAEAARLAGWPITFDTALVEALVAAAGAGGDSADALPILAITLQRMATRRRAKNDGRISLTPEEAKAFVENVVSDAVDEALRSAGAGKEDLRKLVIPRLATWDPDAGRDGAAKRQVTAEGVLFSGDRARLRALADELVNQRLLTRSRTDAGVAYEVTHEALLRVPPLGNMILECREKFEQARILQIETRDWAALGKSADCLVRSGERLKDAFDLMEDRDFGSDLREKKVAGDTRVSDYLTACRKHEERRRNRGRRIVATVVAGLSLLTVAAVWMAIQAVKQRNEAFRTDGESALVLADIAKKAEGNRFPDQIFYHARAIGFDGYGREEIGSNQFQTLLDLFLGNKEPYPILLGKDTKRYREVKTALSLLPKYLPFWRSQSFGAQVTALRSDDDKWLFAGFSDGRILRFEIANLAAEPTVWRKGGKAISDLWMDGEKSGIAFVGEEGHWERSLHDTGEWKLISILPAASFAWNDEGEFGVSDEKPEAPVFISENRLELGFATLEQPGKPICADLRARHLFVGLEDGSMVGWNVARTETVANAATIKAYLPPADGGKLDWFRIDPATRKIDLNAAMPASLMAASQPQARAAEPFPEKPEPFKLRHTNGIGMELVYLGSGKFMMGSETQDAEDDEKPRHPVRLTVPFWIGKHEVTQREYLAVMGVNPSSFKTSGLDAPVEQVTWHQATKFCEHLTRREIEANRIPKGWRYTLPTEAQWEYACRGGLKEDIDFNVAGKSLDDLGWYIGNSAGKTHPVGLKLPNVWGLHDMHGNVREWCLDDQREYQAGTDRKAVENPSGPPSGEYRVYRGGSWVNDSGDCRSADRYGDRPGGTGDGIGFRVASVPNPDAERTERTTGQAAEARDEPAATQGGSGVSGVGTQNK